MTLERKITGFAVALVLVGAAAATLTSNHATETQRIDALEAPGPGPLDGLTFIGMLGPEGQALDVEDTFVFADGTFVSKECELRCDYPARPYSATQVADGWRFESTTRCPYKDATIAWRGHVNGDRIEGVATWSLRRWYWTVERDFAFEAKRDRVSELVASDG